MPGFEALFKHHVQTILRSIPIRTGSIRNRLPKTPSRRTVHTIEPQCCTEGLLYDLKGVRRKNVLVIVANIRHVDRFGSCTAPDLPPNPKSIARYAAKHDVHHRLLFDKRIQLQPCSGRIVYGLRMNSFTPRP